MCTVIWYVYGLREREGGRERERERERERDVDVCLEKQVHTVICRSVRLFVFTTWLLSLHNVRQPRNKQAPFKPDCKVVQSRNSTGDCRRTAHKRSYDGSG